MNPDPPDDETLRLRMVLEQLAVSERGIHDERVLRAMTKVPRHEFVSSDLRSQAYEDHPLPIGHEQTISQPYVVAFMAQALALKPADRVLEIGTGCGYQAAVLAEIVAEVFTIEIVEPLGLGAARTLTRLGCRNIHLRIGDGTRGWPEAAPFDAIVVACSSESVPDALVGQLKDGGRLIIPIGHRAEPQNLCLLKKENGGVKRSSLLPVRFVPMTREPAE